MLAAYQAFNEQITSEYLQTHPGNSNAEILDSIIKITNVYPFS